MAFTDNCDIFGAIHEGGINRVVRHVMRQRPSLFNYASAGILERPERVCRPIDAHPVVIARGNPLATPVQPIPILGSAYGLDFCAQFAVAEIDFSPGNVVTLPPQLNPPLAAQRFALHGAACAGLGCPAREVTRILPDRPLQPGLTINRPRRTIVIPSEKLECFCLDLFMVADVDAITTAGKWQLLGKLDGLELVDLAPEGLENSIECYAKLFIQLVLLPQLAARPIELTQDLMGTATVTLLPSPTSAAIPNNPAIEDDQLKVFIDLVTGPPPPPAPPGPPGPPAPPPVPGTIRPRVRTGPADATVAVSETGVRELFGAFRDGFRFSKSNSSSGAISLSYAVEAHLEGGTIELRNDGTIRVRELDVKWDTLRVCLGINIPEICVGGFCIIPIPFDGCAVRAPRLCAFSGNPDLSFCLDIGGLVTSEVSATVRPLTKYAVNPARTPGMNDWDAKDAGIPNKWQVLIDPVTIDLDLFDIADIVGDLLEDAVDAAIDGLLGGLPDWAKDLIRAILGPIIDLIRDILDFGDDLVEWLSDQIGVSLGLFNFLLTALADYFAEQQPIVQIEDPLPTLEPTGSLIRVMIPVEFLGVRVNTDEMILEVDIGA